MKHIKLFENYYNSDDNTLSIYLDESNKYINNSLIEKTILSFPNYLKSKIEKFLNSGESIDIDKMISISKKYNIFERVKELYDSGIRNIDDIYKKLSNFIYPKNESIFGVEIISLAALTILTVTVLYLLYNLINWHDSKYFFIGMSFALIMGLSAAGLLIFKGFEAEREFKQFRSILEKENIEILSTPQRIRVDNKNVMIILLEKDGVKKITELKNIEYYMDSNNVKNIFEE